MKTILVDDMLLDLQLFELKCADMPDFEIVGKFTDPNAAIEYAAGHVVDFALLDIDMPGMDGIHLAQALRRLRSDIIIVFATAHPKFAVEALKMKADYIIFKPFDREDIADVMERAKLLRRRQCKRIHFHTFGAFDMLVDGEPVHFRSGKAKELMALCVYRDGRPVSIHEIVENLWGENADGTGYRRTIKELADTLRDYGAEEMFLRSRGSLRVRMDLADSDFQAFMSGDEDAICQFQGVFMQQYSWAEPMVCTLQEKKELMLARMGGEKGICADWGGGKRTSSVFRRKRARPGFPDGPAGDYFFSFWIFSSRFRASLRVSSFLAKWRRDGAEQGTNLALYRELAKIEGLDITASGGVSSLEELRELRKIGTKAAILGKALYTGRLDLKTVIREVGAC